MCSGVCSWNGNPHSSGTHLNPSFLSENRHWPEREMVSGKTSPCLSLLWVAFQSLGLTLRPIPSHTRSIQQQPAGCSEGVWQAKAEAPCLCLEGQRVWQPCEGIGPRRGKPCDGGSGQAWAPVFSGCSQVHEQPSEAVIQWAEGGDAPWVLKRKQSRELARETDPKSESQGPYVIAG